MIPPPDAGAANREPPPAEPPWFQPAVAALLDAEPAFRRVALPLPWVGREPGFRGLLRTICGQHVSHAAALGIWRRLAALPGALDPRTLPELDDGALCGLGGLTRARAAHARALACAVREGALDFARVRAAPDDEAVAMLRAVRGVGPWTAEVYLVLAEARPDVMPAGDVAIQAGAAHALGLPARPDARGLRALAAGWAPFRAVAARLLWHHWLLATNRPVWDRE